MEQKIERPMCLEMRDAKEEIVKTVNAQIKGRGIPCFLMRGILEEVLTQIKEIERNEIAEAEKIYAAAIAKEEKAE